MRDLGTGAVKGIVKMAELKVEVEEGNSVGGLYEPMALVKVKEMIESWQYKMTVKMPREQCRPPLDYLQILFPDHEWAQNEKDRDRRK